MVKFLVQKSSDNIVSICIEICKVKKTIFIPYRSEKNKKNFHNLLDQISHPVGEFSITDYVRSYNVVFKSTANDGLGISGWNGNTNFVLSKSDRLALANMIRRELKLDACGFSTDEPSSCTDIDQKLKDRRDDIFRDIF